MLRTKIPSVFIRALEPEDLELLYTIENDEELWEVSNCCTPLSKYAIKQYLALQPQDFFQCGELRLAIEDVEEGRTLGLLDLTGFSAVDNRAEVGITLLSNARGRGIGRAVLEALSHYAQEKLRLRLLFAQIAIDNEKSRKIFESVGYEQVAVLPEWHYVNGHYQDIVVYRKKLQK